MQGAMRDVVRDLGSTWLNKRALLLSTTFGAKKLNFSPTPDLSDTVRDTIKFAF